MVFMKGSAECGSQNVGKRLGISCLPLTQTVTRPMDARRRLVEPVAKVPLRCAIVAVHADEDLDQEVEVGACLEFLPDKAPRAVRMGVR